MPGPSIRCICRQPRNELVNNAVTDRRAASKGDCNETIIFESKELCHLMKKSEYCHIFPTGHFLIVAHSKTKRGSRRFAKGRPLVDQAIALELVSYVRGLQVEIERKTKGTA